MNLSLAITTYNRFELTVKSFEKVMHDDRIDEVVILDDASTDGSYQKLREAFGGEDKARVIGKLTNTGMARNKFEAIGYARNQWAIIFDSDNVIDTHYLDALEATLDLFEDPSEIYMPEFARPTFDYRKYAGLAWCAKNVREVSGMEMFGALCNTCNYVVNREFYLNTWKANPAMLATDTIWHALQHLKSGGGFYVVPGMQYDHLVHPDSGFMKDVNYNMDRAMELERQIKAL